MIDLGGRVFNHFSADFLNVIEKALHLMASVKAFR